MMEIAAVGVIVTLIVGLGLIAKIFLVDGLNESNVVLVILIMINLIGLVLIFKDSLADLVNNILFEIRKEGRK